MHIHTPFPRWVVWWLYAGLVFGVVILTNIFLHTRSAADEELILSMGLLHWVLAGFVCYGYGGIQVRGSSQQGLSGVQGDASRQGEWHPASDFVLPGNHRN